MGGQDLGALAFTEPHLPFHSAASRIRSRARGYAREIAQLPTLDDIALLHRQEESYFREFPTYSVSFGEHRREMASGDVVRIRKEFWRIARRGEATLQMDARARLVFATRVLADHCRQRHGTFERRPLSKEYSTDAIIAALGFDSFLLRKEAQTMVADVFDWIDRSLALLVRYGKNGPLAPLPGLRLENAQGRPLLGLKGINDRELTVHDVKAIYRGFVKFGYVDDYATRLRTMMRFPWCLDRKTRFDMTGGLVLPYFPDALKRTSLSSLDVRPSTLDELAHRGYFARVPDAHEYPEVKNIYVPVRPGDNGFSDIGGIALLALSDCEPSALGGALNDALDTLSWMTYDPFYGKLATYAARYLEKNTKALLGHVPVSEDAKLETTYLGACENVERISTSQPYRRLNSGPPSPLQAILGHQEHDASIVLFRRGAGFRESLAKTVGIVQRRLEAWYRHVKAA